MPGRELGTVPRGGFETVLGAVSGEIPGRVPGKVGRGNNESQSGIISARMSAK